jgi:hypothetical protein
MGQPMRSAEASEHTVTLTPEEFEELLRVLESALGEVRVERRRTDDLAYRDVVGREEAVLRGLLDKLRRARA